MDPQPHVASPPLPDDVPGAGAQAGAPAGCSAAHTPPVGALGEIERDAVLDAIVAAGPQGATPAQIGAAARLTEPRAALRIAELLADGRVLALARPIGYVAAPIADAVRARALERLRERQRERPWLMGLTSIALAQLLALPESVLIRALAVFLESGALAYRSGYYSTPDFTPRLNPDQNAFFDDALAAASAEPLRFETLQAAMRVNAHAIHDLSHAFETLLGSGALAKVGAFVYRGSQIAEIRIQLENALCANGPLTVAQFRTLTGTSRKYAVPLLEFFDATGVTQRVGDVRVLRERPPHRRR